MIETKPYNKYTKWHRNRLQPSLDFDHFKDLASKGISVRVTSSWLADYLGCSRMCLSKWRRKGYGPPFVLFGHRIIRYDFAKLLEWLQSGEQKPYNEFPSFY